MRQCSLAEKAKQKGEEKQEASALQEKEVVAKAIPKDVMERSWNAQATMGIARAPLTSAEIVPMRKEDRKDSHRYITAVPMSTMYLRSGLYSR